MNLSTCNKKSLLLALLIQGALLLSAQNYLVNVRKFTEADGLSHNQVNCFHQDRDGFMWIGTKYGLNRFDGHKFRWFTREQDGLASNFISEIYEDEKGWLWLVHSEEKFGERTYFNIALFHPRTFEVLPFEPEKSSSPAFRVSDLNAIHRLPDGRFIFSTKNGAHFLFSQKNGISKLPFEAGFTLHLAASPDSIWGSAGNRLLRLDLAGEVAQSLPLEKGRTIHSIRRDGRNRLWLVTAEAIRDRPNFFKNTRLSALPESGLTTLLSEPAPGGARIFNLLPFQQNGTMLAFKGQEVFELDEKLKVSYHHPALLTEKSFPQNECFATDRNGVVWYGHREGFWLLELQPSRFQQYLKSDDGEQNSIRGLAEYGDYLFVNSSKDGSLLNLKTGALRSYSDASRRLKDIKCFPMLLTRRGELWTANDRLNQLDSLGNVVSSLTIREGSPPRIWSFFQDGSETWWVGLRREFLYFFNEKKHGKPQLFDRYNGFDKLKEAEKWHFLEDEKGIWMAAQNGLYLLDKQKGIIAAYGEQQMGGFYLPANQFNFIYKDPGGPLWLATGDAGLLKVAFDAQGNASVQQHLTRANGLPSNELYAILEDESGHFWISSANGLIRFDKLSGEINAYFEEQGITHNEFNRLSYFQSADGRIYFGGLNGVTAFHPRDFHNREAYAAPLRWSAVHVFSGKEETLKNVTEMAAFENRLVFNPEDKFITFKISLLDYFYSDRVKYSYLIEGLGDEWTEINANTLQLSGLPYGNFTLRVRAKGRENRYSTDQLAVRILMKRPFYLQWWFLAAFALAIAIGIWQFYNWRIQSLKKQQLLLERMVAERTQKIRSDKQLIEKQAEQLRELDEVKSRFFTNISHELRTPLTLILGPLDSVLKRKRLENRDFTLLSLMRQNGRQLLKRINELLDLSSLDANKLKVEDQPVLLYPLVKKILSGFENTASLKGIRLDLTFRMETAIHLLLDPGKLEKILSNFLSNAIKFTPQNGRVKTAVTRRDNHLHFSVTDTGPGILPEDLERVFERFYQSAQNEKAGGTGIGLALCRELAGLMEGRVWAESEPGHGSTFFLQLPLVETFGHLPATSETPEVETIVAAPAIEPGNGSGETILVVEDNASLLAFIKIILENYRVITAENGQAALEKLSENPDVSLIISDIMMPVMDGFELLRELKAHDDFWHIPVIMLTARQKMETKLEALRIGVDDYMVKPFQEAELLARVDNLIKNNRGRLEAKTAGKADAAPQPAGEKLSAADLKWLSEVEKIILENIGNTQFSIGQLAYDLAMSTRRFQQKIKAVTGLTPKEYQREIQLEYARRLLENGDCRSVSEVSYRVGFKDAHYFSSLFQKRYGKLPSDYL